MRIDQFKRWHWVILGVVLGLVISFWRGTFRSDAPLEERTTLDPSEFERMLVAKPHQGKPLLKNIQVHAMRDGSYWLTAQQLLGDKSPGSAEATYVPVRIHAPTPYVPAGSPAAKPDPRFTVIDYLEMVQAKHTSVDFSTRWWDREPLRSLLHAAVGAALLGGLVPFLMPLLTGGIRSDHSEREEYDLSRFGRGKPQPSTVVLRRGPTEQDIQKLRQVEAELERNLASGGAALNSTVSLPASGAANPSTSQQSVRPLTAGPLESATTPEDKHKEQKHYAGEYYPTETHVKKQN
jgi:hypothetical protein